MGDLPEKSLIFFSLGPRAHAPANLFLNTFARARGPKEKSLKFEHWLRKMTVLNQMTQVLTSKKNTMRQAKANKIEKV